MNNSLKLCFAISAEPTDAFLSQIGMFRLSLNFLGGIYKKADIILSLGAKQIMPLPFRWISYLKGAKLLWADPQQFRKIGYRAQGDNKWRYDYKAYDLIIFCDADTILIKPLDELLLSAREKKAVTGVVAHYPFPHHEGEKPDDLWRSFARKFTGKDIQLNHTYSLLKTYEHDSNINCPFYLNFGFVVMPPELLITIRETYLDIRSSIAPLLKDPFFSGQIALTLATHKHGIPTQSVEMKYNFPNDPIAEKLYPDQLEQISVMHYLRTDKFDRQKIFATEEAFNEFLHLRLEGSNKVFQEHIKKLTNGRYPFNIGSFAMRKTKKDKTKTVNNTIIAVLGMHRSGTSVVARGLKVLGVDLGNNLMPPGGDNPRGYWEDLDINALNVEMLAFLSSDWHFLTPIQPEHVNALYSKGYLLRAVELLRKKTDGIPLFGFKDPRLAKLLPFWKEVFAYGQFKVHFVLTVRHPLSVCDSLAKRNGFEPEKSYLLWLEHVINSLVYTEGESCILVDYDQLMQYPDAQLARIAQRFQFQVDPMELEIFKQDFLDREMRHTTYQLDDLMLDEAAPLLVRDIYPKALDIATDMLQAEDVIFKNNVKQWRKEFFKLKTVLTLADKFVEKNTRTERIMNERAQALTAQIAEREAQVAEKEQAVQALSAQVMEKEIIQVQLSSDNLILQQKLDSVYQSRSWQLTQLPRRSMEIFRQIRSKFSGAASQENRADIILHQSPDEPKVHLDQFHFVIEGKDVNDGSLAVSGWAFHEKWQIQQISLIVSGKDGNIKPAILTHKKERLDVFQQFPFDNAVHSGFWGETELQNGTHQLSLVFRLENEIQIIVDFSVPMKVSSAANNAINNAVRSLRVIIGLATVPRIKAVFIHLMRGNFAYIKERMAYYLRENPKKQHSDNKFDLAYCAQFFHTRQNVSEQNPLEKEIDIIIPVYNGMEHLVRLFDCLFKNTNTPFRVIVVDDHSIDPSVISFLDELAQQNSNILLLRNKENMGFVATINYAASFARNHFVILNTDVEVPKGWLQRLIKPILDGSKVASTTPFTNAGTICSFPLPLVDNPTFGNLDLDVIDAVFQQINSATISIELPTGVGFCMGINLKTWKKIGPFDEEQFGRGYGEENDWCMRASSAGYQNLMASDLFVYHKHGGSFSSEEKQKLAHENLQKLLRRHPVYQSLVDKFIKADPPQPIRKFASLCLMGIASSGKSLLLIDHEIGGGANVYRKQLIDDRLQAGQAVLLLTYDTLQNSIKLQALYQDYEELFYISRLDDIFILPEYLQIGEIFYNNLVSFAKPLDMINAIRRLQEISGAKLTIAIHDYYPLCTSYTLLDHTGRYCDLPSIETCKACLPQNPYRNPNDPHDIVKWRQGWSDFLEKVDDIICFSESSARLLTQVYDIKREHILIRPHKSLIQFSRKPKVNISEPLNIGVVGALNYAKGAQMVVDVAKIFREHDPSIKITVIGTLNVASRLPNLTITGRYEVFQLPDMLEQYKINLCFFPSICPETFSYVTDELMELGMPLCGYDIGAPAERIRKYRLGHIIQKIDAETTAREIKEFYARLAVLLRN